MLEVKVTVEIPGLPEAMAALADALGGRSKFTCHQCGGNNHHIDNVGIVTFGAAEPKPVDAPVTPAANPTTVQAPAQSAPTTTTAAHTPAAEPVQTTAARTAVVTPTAAPQYTLDVLAAAGAALLDDGKMNELIQLLGKYGVQSIAGLAPTQYDAMAADLKAMGARI